MTSNTPTKANELSNIMQIEDLRERMHRFKLWQDSNLVKIELTQLVIDRKYLTLAFEEELHYAMATKIAQHLMEDCIELTIENNNVTACLTALRR